MNENPKMHRRLEDRLAAAKAGKSLQIVVQGNCGVCKRRSATVPATKTQVMEWFAKKATKGFLKYEIRMLKTGVHRDCQKVADQKVRDAKKALGRAPVLVQMDMDFESVQPDHVQKVMARRKVRAA